MRDLIRAAILLPIVFVFLPPVVSAQCTSRAYNPFTGQFDCIGGTAGPAGPQGPAGPSGSAGPSGGQVLKWSLGVSGTVAVNETSIQSNAPSQSTTLVSCSAHADTAPVGAAMTIDIQNAGTTILTAPLSIADGQTDSAVVTTFANANVTPQSTLKVKALSVGATTAGGYVLVKCDTAYGAARGMDIAQVMYPVLYKTVDGNRLKGIWDAYQECKSDLGGGNPYGSCFIAAWKPQVINAIPWPTDHTEHLTVRLHLGIGIWNVCDSASVADPSGQLCTTQFSLATSNAGLIEGEGRSLATGDTSTIVRAGAAFTGAVPLMMLGDNSTITNQDAYGAVIRNLTVDCNAVAGADGIKNNSAQEIAAIDSVNVRNCPDKGIWLSTIRASNFTISRVEVIPGVSLTASTIMMLLANGGSPRPVDGATLNGLNGYSVNFAAGTTTLNLSGVISGGLTVDTSKIAPGLGPGGQPTYVYITGSGVSGWPAGAYPVTASTATSITVTPPAGATTGTATGGSAQLVPTNGAVICSGTNCAKYGDSSTGTGIYQMNGIHVQHVGRGIVVDAAASAAATGVELHDIGASSDTNTLVRVEASVSTRYVSVFGATAGGAQILIDDQSTTPAATLVTDGYKAMYISGTPATGSGPLVQIPATSRFEKVGVGTSSPAYPLDLVGDLNITGTYRIGGSPASTTINGTSCPLGGSCTTGSGIPVVIDSGTQSNVYVGSNTGCSPFTSANDGQALFFRANNPNVMTSTNAGGAAGTVTFAYCGGTALHVKGRDTTEPIYSSRIPGPAIPPSTDPPTVMLIYRADATPWWELNEMPRGATDSEADQGILTNVYTTPKQTGDYVNHHAPCSSIGGQFQDCGNTTGTNMTAHEPWSNPGSGWVQRLLIADGSTTAGTALNGAGQVLKWSLGVNGTVALNELSVQSNQPTVSTTLNSCGAHADTAPVGSALTIDILSSSGGASVLTAPLSIASGANDSVIVTTFANANVGPTSTLYVKATAIGSTTPGGYVLVKCDTAGSPDLQARGMALNKSNINSGTAGVWTGTSQTVEPTSTSNPLQVKYTAASGSTNSGVLISTATSPIFAGTSPKADFATQWSASNSVSWFMGLVAKSLRNSASVVTYSSGAYADAVCGFRLNQGTPNDLHIMCGCSPGAGDSTPQFIDTRIVASTNPTQLRVWIDDTNSTVHFYNQNSEISYCTQSVSWATHLPSGVPLTPYVAGINLSSGTALSLSIAWIELGATQ